MQSPAVFVFPLFNIVQWLINDSMFVRDCIAKTKIFIRFLTLPENTNVSLRFKRKYDILNDIVPRMSCIVLFYNTLEIALI